MLILWKRFYKNRLMEKIAKYCLVENGITIYNIHFWKRQLQFAQGSYLACSREKLELNIEWKYIFRLDIADSYVKMFSLCKIFKIKTWILIYIRHVATYNLRNASLRNVRNREWDTVIHSISKRNNICIKKYGNLRKCKNYLIYTVS